jgi:outer membrane protein TolC
LSEAVAEVDRAYLATQTGIERLEAARQRRDATAAAFDVGQTTLDLLLESQVRLSAAESRYYRSRVEYARAIKEVQLQKGTLLQYIGVGLSEGPWPGQAQTDAAEVARRWKAAPLNYGFERPEFVR